MKNSEPIEVIYDEIEELQREEGSLNYYNADDQERKRQIHREIRDRLTLLETTLN